MFVSLSTALVMHTNGENKKNCLSAVVRMMSFFRSLGMIYRHAGNITNSSSRSNRRKYCEVDYSGATGYPITIDTKKKKMDRDFCKTQTKRFVSFAHTQRKYVNTSSSVLQNQFRWKRWQPQLVNDTVGLWLDTVGALLTAKKVLCHALEVTPSAPVVVARTVRRVVWDLSQSGYSTHPAIRWGHLS